jgi:23S rRNA (guanine2445-N2)-methyltransferase / 23S rRNA (guanine2069-N7)-methyltransferase
LFCYTGAATVHAALGGARCSTSIDLSATYLDWTRRNLMRNGISETRHTLLRADCMEWLEHNRDMFDLILLDPPTFSNSKRMKGTLDLQRDHATLIRAAARSLSPDGVMIFSTNHKKFKLDPMVNETLAAKDVTRWSLDKDFARTKPAHRCWFIRQRDITQGRPRAKLS